MVTAKLELLKENRAFQQTGTSVPQRRSSVVFQQAFNGRSLITTISAVNFDARI
ncbi:hypothetical protein BSU04_32410 [Caballeronia sordidicola]|uniref:Uncharacterized protein n=1 Tax=Caballeronia sordidicola TaxID=196367 RepID=A0A226WT51_CABSO|nr:hypothetical protein BSU04_32410 [Caballeronia sordidicola]